MFLPSDYKPPCMFDTEQIQSTCIFIQMRNNSCSLLPLPQMCRKLWRIIVMWIVWSLQASIGKPPCWMLECFLCSKTHFKVVFFMDTLALQQEDSHCIWHQRILVLAYDYLHGYRMTQTSGIEAENSQTFTRDIFKAENLFNAGMMKTTFMVLWKQWKGGADTTCSFIFR